VTGGDTHWGWGVMIGTPAGDSTVVGGAKVCSGALVLGASTAADVCGGGNVEGGENVEGAGEVSGAGDVKGETLGLGDNGEGAGAAPSDLAASASNDGGTEAGSTTCHDSPFGELSGE
jgi:hypothetical protein